MKNVFNYCFNLCVSLQKWSFTRKFLKDYQKAIPDIKGEHFKVSADDWNLLTSKFNIYGIPHYALVDKTGRIVNSDLNHLENEPLKKMLLEQINK
jgi:hypothetical protein